MKLGKEVNSDYLFKSFSQMLELESPDVKTLIPEFAEDARLYRSFSEQPTGSYRRQFFDRLRVLNTTTPYPLVLFLFRQPASVMSPNAVDRCLFSIEDYLVRRMLWRGTAQGYNRLFTEIVRDVALDPPRAAEIIGAQLAAAEGSSRLWPRDGDLLPTLTRSRAYGIGAIAQARLLDVLWEVERRRLRSNKHEQLDRPPNLQIEHVMPQSWKKNWPLPRDSGKPQEVAETDRQAAVNRLGNLTLVTDKLNPSLSNAAWPKKQNGLAQHSLLAMNQQLVEQYASNFDEAAIAARGDELARHILAIWPGPPAISIVPEVNSEPEEHGLGGSIGDDRADTSRHPSSTPREAIAEMLQEGETPDQIYKAHGQRREVWLAAIEEEARLLHEFDAFKATAENAAQYAAHTQALEDRVRVLERIVTDKGYGLREEIEALRAQSDDSGVPLSISSKERV